MARKERRGYADFTVVDLEKIHGPARKYNRTTEDIEDMIERVTVRLYELKRIFERSRRDSDRGAAMEAARNWKALEGVSQALRWALAEEGVEHPLY